MQKGTTLDRGASRRTPLIIGGDIFHVARSHVSRRFLS
jgi:hypothetical protein